MSDASMTPYNQSGGPAWTVTNVAETTSQDATGRYTKGKVVTYQLGSGAVGTVFIPDANWSPDTVKVAVMSAAAKLSAVLGLSSNS